MTKEELEKKKAADVAAFEALPPEEQKKTREAISKMIAKTGSVPPHVLVQEFLKDVECPDDIAEQLVAAITKEQ